MSMIMASIVYCLVGCNSGAESGESLHMLECNTETGEAKIVQTINDVQGTTYFQFNREHTAFYTMMNASKQSVIAKYAIANGKIGKREKIARLPCEPPCHIGLSRDGKEIAFAAYSSATAGTFNIANGKLISTVLSNDGLGPRDDRQQKAFAHCAFYTPDDKFVGIINLGCDRIHFFERGENSLENRDEMMIKTDPGDGPRHAIFSRDGRFLFLVNELSSTVASYSFDGKKFSRLSKLAMTPDGTDPKSTKAAAIKLSADGKLLMASNRGLDSIAFYDVRDDGTLAFRNRANLTGKFPRDFELMPGEKFMVVGHKMSNEIQVYSFNRETCELTPVGKPINCWRPLCFKFL